MILEIHNSLCLKKYTFYLKYDRIRNFSDRKGSIDFCLANFLLIEEYLLIGS
ncbi:hypothetical protein NUACC26_077520 [Scytonema sp. NUACC26]